MSTTTFKKKQLKWAIPGVLLGILLLAIPFFVFAVDIIPPETLPYIYEGNTYEEATSYFNLSYNTIYIMYCEDNENLIIKTGKDLDFVWSCGSGEPHKKALWISCPNGVCGTPTYYETGFGLNTLNPPYGTCFTSNVILTSQNLLAAYTENWGGKNCLNQVYQNDIILEANIIKIPSCELGNCQICEHYDSCIGAGCFWEFSLIYLQIDPKMTGYYCREPYEPDPEQCGAVYKCQYCTTQETCEAEILCEWTNRGFGDKCYMSEAIIPPPQVGWEVPELEDCEELSGTEKLLCEIKNFITGIFMPSQEKVNALVNTFGAFKERFPFNYIGALSNFFSDIKISLNTEKSIPVKILGQESEVSFTLFDKTTVIGGQVETFKNVWIDFTTLIIFIVFLVWLLNFIMRFFP